MAISLTSSRLLRILGALLVVACSPAARVIPAAPAAGVAVAAGGGPAAGVAGGPAGGGPAAAAGAGGGPAATGGGPAAATGGSPAVAGAPAAVAGAPVAAAGGPGVGTPAAAAPECKPKEQKVSVTSVGDGWVVTREACPGETEALLVYSHGDKGSGTVAGKLTDKLWSFGIHEKIEENELLRLEFQIASKPSTDVDQEAHRAFAEKVRAELKAAFDDAVKVALQTSPATQDTVLKAQFTLAARTRINALLKRETPDTYVTKTESGFEPWTDAVLVKAGFRKLATGDWEPSDVVLDKLKSWSTPDAQLLSGIRRTSPPASDVACFNGSVPKSGASSEVLNLALKSCVTALAGAAQSLAGAKDANAVKFSKLSQEEPAALATQLVRVDTTEPTANGGSPLLKQTYSEALQKLDSVQAPPGKQAQQKLFDDSEQAVLYLAGLQVASVLQVKATALNDSLVPPAKTLLALNIFRRENLLGEVFKIEPAKPRFFVSTGLVVTSLNSGIGDPFKLSVPVMVSICLSPHGCETKGIGAGGTPGMYVSADLGVKTFWIGSRNPRENAPSFLFGLGFTPFYATHIGLGVNAFDNPQTNRANFAPYLSVTVDVVDGKDILGSLGVAPPKAQPIGNAQP